jgi:hypothetical protein
VLMIQNQNLVIQNVVHTPKQFMCITFPCTV